MRTTNKREVRAQLYSDVRELLPRASSFGMLAGPAPDEEISCIRLRFFRPEIFAFDIDAAAIEAARASSVEAIRANVRHEKPFRDRRIDFFNLDLYRTLTTERPVIENVAKHARLGLAVFVSYDGRCAEKVTVQETTSYNGRVMLEEPTNYKERVIAGETTNVLERVILPETTIERERDMLHETSTESDHVIARETPRKNEHARTYKTASGSERARYVETAKQNEQNERVTHDETTRWAERAKVAETSDDTERVEPAETTNGLERVIASETTNHHERLTVEQSTRITLLDQIIRAVRPEAKLARVYAYRGQGQGGIPMIGALFLFTKKNVQQLPPFCPTYEEHTAEREFQLRGLGVSGKQLHTRLKNGRANAKRKKIR